MEFIAEIFVEIYLEMMLLFIPENNIGKRFRVIATVTAVCCIAALEILAIWGLALIFDHHNLWGILPLGAAVLLSLAQIIAGIMLYNKHH